MSSGNVKSYNRKKTDTANPPVAMPSFPSRLKAPAKKPVIPYTAIIPVNDNSAIPAIAAIIIPIVAENGSPPTSAASKMVK